MVPCTVNFETLGCRLNQIETEAAARSFADAGFACSFSTPGARSCADETVRLVVVNTCSVTSKAEQKARRLIRLILSKFPNAAVIVTGCYAQLSEDYLRSMSSRIAVLPGRKKGAIADVPALLARDGIPESAQRLAEYLNDMFRAEHANARSAFRLHTDTLMAHSRASIKIQDGCSNSCTFCCIRIARGRSISLDAGTVIERCVHLERAGQREIVFTGVNLSQYKSERNGTQIGLAGILQCVIEATRSVPVAVSSLYPESVTDALCAVIASPRVQPRFHLSVQSGSDTVLNAMGRRYTADDVRTAVRRLRQAKPRCFVSCDIIAGFPGETQEDFSQTMRLCGDAGFSWVHVFPFSPRPGTAAYRMKPRVQESVVRGRVMQLAEFAKRAKIAFISSCVGQRFSAVVERPRSGARTGTIRCVTQNFIHAECIVPDADAYPQGTVIMVEILCPLEEAIMSGTEEAEARGAVAGTA